MKQSWVIMNPPGCFPTFLGLVQKGAAQGWAGKGSLFLTLLLKEICHGLHVQGGHSHQPGASCPTSLQRSLPFPLVPSQAGGGRLGKPRSAGLARAEGYRDAAIACSLLRGRRGAGGGRAAPVAWQLPCKSPSCQKTFFSSDLDGFSQVQDQVWMIRWF